MAGSNKFTAALEEAEIGLEIIHEKLRAIQGDTIKSAQAINELIKAGNKNTPNGANDNTDKMVKSIGGLTKVVVKRNEVVDDMIKLEKQKNTEIAKSERAQEKLNKQIARNIALTEKERLAKEKANRAYNKINSAFQRMKADYRDLRIKKEMNIALSAKEEKRMLRLETSIMKVDKAMKTTDAKMGIHTRSVGNYGKAFDSLGFSVAQITRESPAFINSMQTGFMAISNNIPTLVDEIDKLKYKNAQLVKDGGKAVPIWKSLGSAIFSYQTAISLAILALTFLGPKLIEIAKNMKKGAENTDLWSDALKSATKETTKQVTEITLLVRSIQNHTGSEDERLRKIKKLNDEYPEFNSNLLTEKQNTEEINKELKKYIRLVILRQEVEEGMKTMVELTIKLRDEQEALNEAEEDLGKSKRMQEQVALYDKGGVALENLTGSAQRYVIARDDMAKTQEKLDSMQKGYIERLDEINGLETEGNTIKEGTIAYYEDLISKNDSLIKNKLTTSEDIDILQDENKEYQAKIDKLIGIEREGKKAVAIEHERKDAQEGIIEGLEKRVSLLGKLIKMETNPERLKFLQNAQKEAKKQLEFFVKGQHIQLEGQDKILASMKSYQQGLINTAKAEQVRQENLEKTLRTIDEFVQASADLGIALIERKVEALEQEKTALEEKYDAEVLHAEENFTSQEALEDKKIFLEKKKNKEMRKIQNEINKEKRKQAIIDKAAAVSTIAINTAIGVSNAWKKGALFGGLESALILAMGALQTATVLAQPIPQYKHGTENHKGGGAIVGDGGKHEAIITPDGSIYKSPNKDTLMDLPAGTVVKPDYDKFMAESSEAKKQVYDSSLLRSIALGQIQREKDERVLKAIKEQTDVLKRKKLNTTMINKKEDIGHQLWALKQTSW